MIATSRRTLSAGTLVFVERVSWKAYRSRWTDLYFCGWRLQLVSLNLAYRERSHPITYFSLVIKIRLNSKSPSVLEKHSMLLSLKRLSPIFGYWIGFLLRDEAVF